METQRLILLVALMITGLLLWQSWEVRNAQPTQQVSYERLQQQQSADGSVPEMPPEISATQELSLETQRQLTTSAQAQTIRIVTDVLDIELSSAGGDVRKAHLLKYPIELKEPERVIQLMNDTMPRLFVGQSGLISRSIKLPDHHTVYHVEQNEYRLADGENELKVKLSWQDESGIKVIKQLTFKRDSYAIDVDYLVENRTGEPLSLAMYRQMQRGDYTVQGENSFIYTFTGAVVSNSINKYEKIQFNDMDDWQPEHDYAQGGYVAMLQHYFTSAWLANEGEDNLFYSKSLSDGRYVIGIQTAEKVLLAGESWTLHTRMFIGPKDQERMELASPDLRLTVDYGILSVLAEPLFWLLRWIHDILGNWGWSIIVLTIIIKLCFYPLTDKQYRSMANLRKLQPQMEAIKERHGDDRQKMGQAMMALYKKEKVNPLAGCLPILVQIPVFIALYWVLVESVEIRQADFMWWLNDLSSADPYYILPFLMAVSMFIMQKLSPKPSDPIQAKVMMSLPIVFGIFFAFFPAGLVLYWFFNNLLSILQQWYITKQVEAGK
ncbi:Inner membrane protein translocase and chaperone YidC, long form [hydrothermal vent metagenome]|uniref:Membrane protein insertase YidC n=1 Tax=hydrothermal vent metagenome TaxID=652676 RepID=A0A3B0Z5N0_9ZZZZ